MLSKNMSNSMNELYSILLQLGISPRCHGFLQVAYAASLSAQSPELLHSVTKQLYPDIARHFQTSPACVERNIRTIINIAWKHNPDLLKKISNGYFSSRPTATEFISLMTFYYLDKKEKMENH